MYQEELIFVALVVKQLGGFFKYLTASFNLVIPIRLKVPLKWKSEALVSKFICFFKTVYSVRAVRAVFRISV